MPQVVLLLACGIAPLAIVAQDMAEPTSTAAAAGERLPQPRPRRGPGPGRVYKTSIRPHWFDDGARFWYRNDLRSGRREFVLVDVASGARRPAFNHQRLAEALREAGLPDVAAERLPLVALEFDTAGDAVVFRAGGDDWRCPLKTYQLEKNAAREVAAEAGEGLQPLAVAPRASARTGPETQLTFANQSDGEVELFWVDSQGGRRSYGKVPAGESHEQHTFAGHAWEVADGAGRLLAAFVADEQPARAVITGQVETTRGRRQGPRRSGRPPRRPSGRSPDGKWMARVADDGNIQLRPSDSADDETQLTQDAEPQRSYGMLQWSPDSQTLVAFRIQPGEEKEVHLVESSPDGGGRAALHSRPYALPGDRMTSYELSLFDVAEKKQIEPQVDPIDFGRPRLRWHGDRRFTYSKTDRGHQRFRVIEIDCDSGQARNVIDEQSETFIWTAHGPPLAKITYLEKTNEIIYVSERDGWRRLYLVDLDSGEIVNQITKGPWVVRDIEEIDEEKRQIRFTAGGIYPDQDPYLIHHCRVDFDGSHLVQLTAGDGSHSIQFSPDGRHIIDTYSRVDLAPVHELRRVADGQLVCELERADDSQLRGSGWEPPEVFSAKGRDGQTDIWGIICRPPGFDPEKRYPVIESIYAGPHGSHVPKTFSPAHRHRALTSLGFVVVQIDGMGTANRSKAFHDVCWQNLKDAGLPDRILWIKAAAKERPYMDVTRVGIYGTSAGGQNAAGAVLFHPEFYKAAVAACGCHDNRMDKASWNEQWMGYPVGPHYAECSNIENAHRLQGHLLLIVGEMDTNVPPESTMRFVDALIKADRDFELLVIPGAGHTNGGRYGTRRMHEFFVRRLQDSAGDSSAARVSVASSTADAEPPALDLKSTAPAGKMAAVAARFRADLASLGRFHPLPQSPARQQRLRRFLSGWSQQLGQVDAKALSDRERQELTELRDAVRQQQQTLRHEADVQTAVRRFAPFGPDIVRLAEARQRIEPVDSRAVAAQLSEMARQIDAARTTLSERLESRSSPEPDAILCSDLLRAAEHVASLRATLKAWHAFYDGYDPVFTWWMREPYTQTDKALQQYEEFLKRIGQREADRIAAAGADDAPDVQALLNAPTLQMPAIIERYQAERRSLRGPPRSRRRRESDQPAGNAAPQQLCRRWQQALKQLDFESLERDDQVDFVLLSHDIDYQLKRLQLREDGLDQLGPARQDDINIVGYPIGREALLAELDHELIPYTPRELVDIAEQEYAWCEAELKKASREMGCGDDWRRAVEKVKSMHVQPGKQPQLIRDLAWEAIHYLEEHDLVTIPPLARETWRMQMMPPDRQRINPFFTGGEVIRVSYPTDSMSHEDKLQSMRGNNIPFARATVHHELIPGHHLQGFMTDRHRPHRRHFATPFWGEGWALYWEMVLYDRGFPQTPEDRVGFLVWRAHRCARIVFSLNFHLGRMTPGECVDYLVANVGFERTNAEAEVRRSVGRGYSPLYQAAYMLGGLQLRRLRRELVDSGRMEEKAFHDAILRQNRIPIALLRAVLTQQPLTPQFDPQWRFYE